MSTRQQRVGLGVRRQTVDADADVLGRARDVLLRIIGQARDVLLRVLGPTTLIGTPDSRRARVAQGTRNRISVSNRGGKNQSMGNKLKSKRQ